jgi:hypothetical protein
MAKVYSHSESRAKGSVGMTTYRTVRGKVIQSQKISPWDAAVESVGAATRWNDRTALLGIISLFCALHGQSIKNSFNRTKNGSQRNYFMKKNYAAMKAAFANLATAYAATKVVPTMQAIEDALGSYAALHANTVLKRADMISSFFLTTGMMLMIQWHRQLFLLLVTISMRITTL